MMQRRTFFKSLGVAIAATLVSKPILDALAIPETPCYQGLIYQIDQSGNYSTLTYKQIEELLDGLLFTPTTEKEVTILMREEDFKKYYEDK